MSEKTDKPVTCCGCGVPFEEHIGVQGTCVRLQSCINTLEALAVYFDVTEQTPLSELVRAVIKMNEAKRA